MKKNEEGGGVTESEGTEGEGEESRGGVDEINTFAYPWCKERSD